MLTQIALGAGSAPHPHIATDEVVASAMLQRLIKIGQGNDHFSMCKFNAQRVRDQNFVALVGFDPRIKAPISRSMPGPSSTRIQAELIALMID